MAGGLSVANPTHHGRPLLGPFLRDTPRSRSAGAADPSPRSPLTESARMEREREREKKIPLTEMCSRSRARTALDPPPATTAFFSASDSSPAERAAAAAATAAAEAEAVAVAAAAAAAARPAPCAAKEAEEGSALATPSEGAANRFHVPLQGGKARIQLQPEKEAYVMVGRGRKKKGK